MITIYYANFNNQLVFQEPISIIKNYTQNTWQRQFLKCPAWLQQNKNTFGIKSTQEFSITSKDGTFTSDYSPEWCERNIEVRDRDTCSFEKATIFFTMEDSLIVEQRAPVLENNDIKTKTTLVEGAFDLGKWPRPFECAVIFNQNDTIKVFEDDIIYYVKFHTNEKIKFQKFLATEEIQEMLRMPADTRKLLDINKAKIKPLEYFYSLIDPKRYKKIVYKKIKENLL